MGVGVFDKEICNNKFDETLKGEDIQQSNTAVNELQKYQKSLKKQLQKHRRAKRVYMIAITIASMTIVLSVMCCGIESIVVNVPVAAFTRIMSSNSKQEDTEMAKINAEIARVEQVIVSILLRQDTLDFGERQEVFEGWTSLNSWNSSPPQ